MIMLKVYFIGLCSVLLALIPQFHRDPSVKKQLARNIVPVRNLYTLICSHTLETTCQFVHFFTNLHVPSNHPSSEVTKISSIKVVSYNVKGLHNLMKRRKILKEMDAKCQIAYLQETHVSDA